MMKEHKEKCERENWKIFREIVKKPWTFASESFMLVLVFEIYKEK
jgi:hypothetical protein